MIDFVIPCHPKDFPSLRLCVDGIRNNTSVCNKIFIVSKEDPKIEKTFHVPEEKYFQYVTKEKIEEIWNQKNSNLAYRSKWVYQQFLKLLSARVISELSDSYVIVDSDTIFLRDVYFESDKFYYCKAQEYHLPYLQPTKILLDVEQTIGFSCISHHMIFNKEKLQSLLESVEMKFGGKPFVECVLDIIDYNEASCLSEWDLYANYMILNYPEMCEQRQLIWEDISFIPVKSHLEDFKENFDFVSCHAYIRGIE
jgi:hypothetical protein